MAKRNPWGAIRKLPHNGRFQASYIGPDGFRHNAPDTFRTKTDASIFLAGVRGQISEGKWVDPNSAIERPECPEFMAFALTHINMQTTRAGENLRKSTKSVYLRQLEGHCKPLMGKPVDKISKQMVDHLFASITSSGKLSTASKVYKLLSSIFKRAVDYGYLEKNPCSIKGANNLSSRKKVSTPSATASVSKLITEIRPGVYIFNDSQQVELGSCGFQDVALVAFATVVSGTGQKIVVDSGGKILGADRASWATGYGRLPKYPAARITALSEHHATVIFPKGQKPPKIGSTVTVIPNHVCNAVNLVDYLYLKKADGSLKKLKVLARGKNS